MTRKKLAPDVYTSKVVAALERGWKAIRKRHPELPSVVIVMSSGVEGTHTARYGHWAPVRWERKKGDKVGEVMVAGELLSPEAGNGHRSKKAGERVMSTLIHEAGHALADVRKQQDTSRNGRYHNGRYKKVAEELGLVVDKDPTYGWTLTSLSPAAVKAYKQQIDALEKVLTAWRTLPEGLVVGVNGAKKKTKKKKPGRALLECRCPVPRKIYVAHSVAAEGPILCGLCEEEFEEVVS